MRRLALRIARLKFTRMEGMPVRKRLPHDVPFWVQDGAPFFITLCCVERGRVQLTRPEVAQRLFAAMRYYQAAGDWWCRIVTLMPDHLHAILSFPLERPMRQAIRKFKIYTARYAGVCWQRGFFDHRLRNENEYFFKVRYVRDNPVRVGLIARAEDWPYTWES